MDIKKKAERLIHRFRTNDPFQIAKELGIQILYADLGSTWGYCITAHRIRFIELNINLDPTRQRYTCAHELGHALLHKGLSIPYLHKHTLFSKGIYELQANTFAAELLLPDTYIKDHPDQSIYDLAKSVGLPEEFVKLKE